MPVSLCRRSSAALASVILFGGGALAQGSPARWLDLVQMPVAVAHLELAGVPVADLRMLIPVLNVNEVPPGRFLETIRGLPLLAYEREQMEGNGLGGYVRELHARGLRGAALADAIHRELRSRGIPAGPKHRASSGHDVLHQDFLPPGLRQQLREGRRRGRAGSQDAPGQRGDDSQARGESARGRRDAPGRGQGVGRGGPGGRSPAAPVRRGPGPRRPGR